MQQLYEIVNFYLTNETNYALMITGEWGIGKTYYYKTVLENNIKEISTCDKNNKKYRPILVSLFGLKSIEEIQTEILLSLYPIFKDKKIKLGTQLAKVLIKGVLNLKNLGSDLELEIDKGDWINFSELVICFDDLERLSENLKLEEFIGFINTLVENENVKVIIIAYANKIENKKFIELKEKVIGNTIEFIPDLNESFVSLIKLKFSAFPTYLKFLSTHKEYILEFFTSNSSNLRTLSFTLLYFRNIFFETELRISQNDILYEKENEILKILLKFSIAIAIEYKDGNIIFKDKKGLDHPKLTLGEIQFGQQSSSANKDNDTFREKFKKKYYTNEEYFFFSSIYNFLTGGSIFIFDKLKIELNKLYYVEDNEILPEYIVFKKLVYPALYELREKEYKKLTNEMLKYSDQGVYDLSYGSIKHIV